MNPIYADMPTSIFEQISRRAREVGAINLGQGFPDDPGPADVRAVAAAAVMDGSNQYPPMMGLPTLREAVAKHYRRFHGLAVDADNVLVTSGATEAIAAALLATITPGDEVVLLQPMYDAYLPLIERAGGVARPVTLQPPDWRLPIDEIEAVVGPKTRVIVLNNPINPVARVFSIEELTALARLCVAHDLVAICDEVWEHILFDGRRHHPLLGMPGMERRAIKIGSAGKIFSLTGWKVGFVVAAPELLGVVAKAHQYLAFSTPPNLQEAVAFGLAKEDAYFAGMRGDYQGMRDRFANRLRAGGYAVLPSEGTYFLCLDLAASGVAEDDRDWCFRLIGEAGVAAIPMSAFYATAPRRSLVRLCFAKSPETLDLAADRIVAFRP